MLSLGNSIAGVPALYSPQTVAQACVPEPVDMMPIQIFPRTIVFEIYAIQ